MSDKRVFSVFCRMVGCGGTTVDFRATPDGLVATWSNENGEWDDGLVSWDRLRAALAHAPPLARPSGPAPKHNPQPKKRKR